MSEVIQWVIYVFAAIGAFTVFAGMAVMLALVGTVVKMNLEGMMD